ncbi:addiction module protein [Mucilaginibacter psychrotolerans]|uniref:Addiction module protein n=1 Tax=Mucilaginibacter psychrotolerans TaxID=1524096 RepID=A0A4Y8SQM7_9SPHI|nr:addiction module protein [Mucilaginibacter psychrotolerans]TFF40935.1 hypothetical protein E2R66_01805 [Mucilaginibacter psychrotolerans]
MTVSVNPQNKQEEKVLLAFLDSLKYDYETEEDDLFLTDEQQAEVLKRDKAFMKGKTTARDWNEIKQEMDRVYR